MLLSTGAKGPGRIVSKTGKDSANGKNSSKPFFSTVDSTITLVNLKIREFQTLLWADQSTYQRIQSKGANGRKRAIWSPSFARKTTHVLNFTDQSRLFNEEAHHKQIWTS